MSILSTLRDSVFGKKNRRGMGLHRRRHDDPADFDLDKLAGARRSPLKVSTPAAKKRLPRTPTLNQLQTNTCTGFALTDAVVTRELALGLPLRLLSQLFPYFYGRSYSGLQKKDGGAYLPDMVKAAQHFGLSDAKYWPFTDTQGVVNRQPSFLAQSKAYSRRAAPSAYYRVREIESSRELAVKLLLTNDVPIIGGICLDEEFFRDDGSTQIELPKLLVDGAHAINFCGYDDFGPWIHNSYGPNWRQNGYAQLSWDYVCDPTLCFDLYVVDDWGFLNEAG